MAKITEKEVEHIAELARLNLSEKEKVKFTQELSSILDYVEKLKEVDVKNIEPIANISGLCNIMREDKIKPSLLRKELLQNAPKQKNGYLKVKAVLE